MNRFYIGLGIFLILAFTRFIPHPPNFTSLIALSFYVPAIFGLRFLPLVLISYVLTDLFIGFHNTIFFTWGSVIAIGFLSKYLNSSIILRIFGAMGGATLFFIITNYGVWLNGMYDQSLKGLMESYLMGLPFYGYNIVSTIIFSCIIELIYYLAKLKLKYTS